MSDQQRPLNPDPHASLTVADLAIIVASHDQLQAWNDRNAQALQAGGEHPDPQVVKNIQSTAALIAQTEKSVSSQNFELMRALNLYDRTLSPAEMAQGFAEGSWNKLIDKVNQTVVAFTKPGDMSLQHSQARADTLLNVPQKIADAANGAWQHPERVPTGLHQALQAQLAELRQALVQSMVAEHPSHALGAVLGATVTGAVIDNFNPAGRGNTLVNATEHATANPLDWHAYATLLGDGTHPPPLKPLRDFSDWMTPDMPELEGAWSRVSYEPSTLHMIDATVLPQGIMSYMIKAMEDREKHGSGSDLFVSAVKTLHDKGISIRQIDDDWTAGPLGSNWNQFMDEYQAGASMEQAAKRTFTGRMAARLGLTSVDLSDVSWAVETRYHTLSPVFKRPDWGSDPAGNDYANAWVLAQGRPGLEVTPRVNVDVRDAPKALTPIPEQVLEALDGLPEKQREVVLRRVQVIYASPPVPTTTITASNDNHGPER